MTRAARDHLKNQPAFSAEAALAALHWLAQGHGCEVTGLDVREVYGYAMEAAQRIGQADEVRIRVERILAGKGTTAKWMQHTLSG